MFEGSKQEVSLNRVREDYMLDSFVGKGPTANRRAFMEILSSEEGIRQHPAPAFAGASDCLKAWKNEGMAVVYMTARPEPLRKATEEELRRADIPFDEESIRMLGDPCLETQDIPARLREFKRRTLGGLLAQFDVLALIGDRPDDFEAASKMRIPFVLYASSLSDSEIMTLQKEEHVGFFVNYSWYTIPNVVRDLEKGISQLRELREGFSAQYSTWLGHLDAKCGILVAMSGGLSALGGAILLKELEVLGKNFSGVGVVSSLIITVAVVSGMLAMVFGIKGYTSRRTSGALSGKVILASLKQAVAILLGRPKSWSYRENDPIHDFMKIRTASLSRQSRAHYDFFFALYRCYDPEALSNLRLYELRATNYMKVYAERWGSRMALVSLFFIVVWLVVKCAALVVPSTFFCRCFQTLIHLLKR
jgi:phosphoglycolate phosphatase-like HAD superfamily hydrolase